MVVWSGMGFWMIWEGLVAFVGLGLFGMVRDGLGWFGVVWGCLGWIREGWVVWGGLGGLRWFDAAYGGLGLFGMVWN